MSRDRAARIDPAPAHADLRGASAAVGGVDAGRRQNDPPRRPLLTAAEAADYLGLSLPAFYAWAKRHHIPNAINSRALRFREEDLLARRTNPATDTVVDFAELGRQHARGGFPRA